ncbi:MAG: hypothetical protein LBD64_01780 [Odoribacteraceae bacterium]|jgi:hypothetical protein|nr:hypothetical protein [Odoribacteraceae bacterium]
MDLYYFNPDNEIAIAHGGRGYTPTANIARMARELAYLPAYLAGREDRVLVERLPDARFLDERRELLGMECRPVTLEEASRLHFNALRPWGWSPRVLGLLEGIPVDAGGRESWTPDKRMLYARATALSVLERARRALELPDDIFPRAVDNVEGVVERARRQAVVIKSPWSSSGKGLLMTGPGEVGGKEREWVSGVLRRQGHVMVEKRLDKVADFALEFWIDPSAIRYAGFSLFFTGEKGEYRGNRLGPRERLEREITRHVGASSLEAARTVIARVLLEVFGGRYRGPLGVDMMLYRDEGGTCRVHPCVEINARYNMGIIALNLSGRYLSPGSEGMFRISYHPRAGEAYRVCRERAGAFPARVDSGRVLSGYFPLTPVDAGTCFVAAITCSEFARER